MQNDKRIGCDIFNNNRNERYWELERVKGDPEHQRFYAIQFSVSLIICG
jgi:hypothetical protein